jgi:hypothetical protein
LMMPWQKVWQTGPRLRNCWIAGEIPAGGRYYARRKPCRDRPR